MADRHRKTAVCTQNNNKIKKKKKKKKKLHLVTMILITDLRECAVPNAERRGNRYSAMRKVSAPSVAHARIGNSNCANASNFSFCAVSVIALVLRLLVFASSLGSQLESNIVSSSVLHKFNSCLI